MPSQLLWIPLLPFLGFLVNGLLGSRLPRAWVSLIGCLAPIAAFLITMGHTFSLESGEAIVQLVFRWIEVESNDGSVFSAPFKLRFDSLSAVMCWVITGIGSLIHLYSTGYMHSDPSYHRFFAYLNLFTAFMLVLVLADNLLLLFVGWEGVGLCSYLLIGFWYSEDENATAGKKAFIVNRIGDFGVLIASFLLLMTFGTLDLVPIGEMAKDSAFLTNLAANPVLGWTTAGLFTVITLLLFLGCTGKSAQIPLYVWLPDAMAGPTPVSALIHAATMVTSGVYLCCRLNPLFSQAAELATTGVNTMEVIAVIGAVTAITAALIALTQNDIKKVLAYSTVSQLGYMFFAVGLQSYSAAFFHVVTHAFFKALLFLGSGSVIHAMHHEQDMRRMGGLKAQLPRTHLLFLIGTLALAGFPLMAGFISKDEILYVGFKSNTALWAVAWVTAGLTAFYMFRLMAMTFWGESRVDPKTASHVEEPGGWMEFALWVLAILSVLGGTLNWPHFLPAPFEHAFLTHYTGLPHGPEVVGAVVDTHASHAKEWISAGLSVAMAAAGIFLALFLYGGGKGALQKFAEESAAGRALTSWSRNKFYVDELYDFVVVKPLEILAGALFYVVDRFLIDFLLVRGTAGLTQLTAEGARRIQSGFIPAYLATFGLGAALLLWLILFTLRDSG